MNTFSLLHYSVLNEQMVTYFASNVETTDLVRQESFVSFLLNKDHLLAFRGVGGRHLAVNFVKFGTKSQ